MHLLALVSREFWECPDVFAVFLPLGALRSSRWAEAVASCFVGPFFV